MNTAMGMGKILATSVNTGVVMHVLSVLLGLALLTIAVLLVKLCSNKRDRVDGMMFQVIMDNIPCQVFIKDVENNFRYKLANKNFIDYYQKASSDIIDKNDFELFEPVVAAQLRGHDTLVVENKGKVFRFDEDISFHRTGNEVFKSLKTYFQTSDQHSFLLGVCVDITDLSRMQQKLKETLQTLQKTMQAQNYFFASMSHEIRTPLNAVIGFTELLRNKQLAPATQNDYLDCIVSAGSMLMSLINDILDLSKLQAGQMEFTPGEMDFGAIVKEVCSVFRQKLSEKHLALHLSIGNMPVLFLDKLRLRQIFFNILGNAVKYTNQGYINMEASFTPETKDKGTLVFKVSDTGIGICKADQAKLFNPFVQAEAMRGTTVANSGTGLGLTIVKRMVQQMGGDITLQSKEGTGTTFTVTIREIPYDKNKKIESVQEEKISRLSKSWRVMAVDDAPMNLKVLKAILEQLGCPVITAGNGPEALEKLRDNEVDVVLTDVYMPEMTGIEMVKEMRKHPQWNHIMVAAVSADTANDRHFDFSVFDEILYKPLEVDKLKSFLCRVK